MEWRLIGLTGADDAAPAAFPGAHNMAVDQALFESAQAEGRPALRFYRWDPACLSLGRNQATLAPTRAATPGRDLVRRPTGGMAVLHDDELTYAVAARVATFGSPRRAYLAIHRALVAGLRRLGVAAAVASGSPDSSARRVAAVCFRSAAPGEVVVHGRKLVGSAQRYERRAVLQHGSILLAGQQERVRALLGLAESAEQDGAGAPATLAELLGTPPGWNDLLPALCAGFEQSLGIRLARDQLSARERARVRALVPHYASEAWTWRR